MDWIDWIIDRLIEMEILMFRKMGQTMKSHKAQEVMEQNRWTQWQAIQAQSLRRLRRELSREANKAFQEIVPFAEKRIEAAFHDGAEAFDEDMRKQHEEAGKQIPWKNLPAYQPEPKTAQEVKLEPLEEERLRQRGIRRVRLELKVTPPGDETFFKINRPKLEVILKDVHRDMDRARYAAAQRASNTAEEIVKKADVYFQTGTMTLTQAIEQATKEAATAGINAIQYKDGRRVQVSTYVEMALRTSAHRAQLTAQGAKRNEWGIYTVVSPVLHSTCDSCAFWQGKVLIDDVYADGKDTGEYPLLSTAIAGKSHFLGPNCRHILATFYPGVTQIPEQSPLDMTKKKYESEVTQRKIELQLRRWKREKEIAQTEEQTAKAERKIKDWEMRMRIHLRAHPQLKRREERERNIA